MKFDPNEVLLDYKGEPVLNDKEKLTWKDVIFIACNSQSKEEILTSEDKIKAYQITHKVFSAKNEVELTVNQLSFVIERVKKSLTPLIIGRTLEKFDPSALPKAE